MGTGIWTDINPNGADREGWHFAYYLETPSEREDGIWYSAFLFRNEARTQFGIREWLGELNNHQCVRQMATRVLKEPIFRESLLSDREDLPKWWKRR